MSTDIAELILETDSSINQAVAVAAKAPAKAPVGTLCVNCDETHDWDGGFLCPACGYHPALKRCMEVEKPRQFHEDAGPANLWEAIPSWAWVLLGGVCAIAGGSLFIRFQLIDNAPLRAAWSFSQIAIAEFATLVVHVLALIHASTKSDRYSPFDLFMKPLELWKPTFATLPQGAWRVWVFVWGHTAMICAAAIIGGMDYNALFEDWGAEKRAKPNIVKAIADEAKKKGGDPGTLEDSLNEAGAGAEGGGGGGSDDDKQPETEVIPAEETEAVLPKAECLIFGFRRAALPAPSKPDDNTGENQAAPDEQDGANGASAENTVEPLQEGEISSLLLATMVNNRLRYVGMIAASSLSEETRAALRARLPQLLREKSFVPCHLPAEWLKPTLMCEIEYEDWGYANQMKKPKFLRMLDDVK